jgi:toxin ParE1/3/4
VAYFARLSDAARADISAILDTSANEFGPQARQKYELLLAAALDALQDNPRRAGVKVRLEVGPDVRTFHLMHVRKKTPSDRSRVRRPRHLLVFRIVEPDFIVIGRVIHDSMELALHVPIELTPDFDL